jgi:hypothetical protein
MLNDCITCFIKLGQLGRLVICVALSVRLADARGRKAGA